MPGTGAPGEGLGVTSWAAGPLRVVKLGLSRMERWLLSTECSGWCGSLHWKTASFL